jgi:hypothetical protein
VTNLLARGGCSPLQRPALPEQFYDEIGGKPKSVLVTVNFSIYMGVCYPIFLAASKVTCFQQPTKALNCSIRIIYAIQITFSSHDDNGSSDNV